MTLKSITCREHGGTFSIEAKRGRPPVRCGEQTNGMVYPLCDMAPRAQSKRRVTEALEKPEVQEKVKGLTLAQWRKAAKDAGFGAATINRMKTPGQFRQLLGIVGDVARVTAGKAAEEIAQVTAARHPEVVARRSRKAAQPASEVETRVNPSVPKAHAAKAQLEPLGWTVTGTASFEGEDGLARITGSRGDELIIIVWRNGLVASQEYILWNTDVPKKNNAPARKLPFDPDEMTDAELVRVIAGMKVTWWNKLGTFAETAIVSKDNVKITHAYSGTGDETPADRVITFVDMNGEGFRSFRVGALLKVG